MEKNKLYDGKIINFIKEKNYKVINSNLGKGSFGKTILVQDPYIEEYFVVKKFDPEIVTDLEEFYNSFIDEIKILFKLNHKNIVRIFNYYPYENLKTGFIFMEYVEGKALDDFMEDYENSRKILTINNLFSQLIDAFECIEKSGIIHRDIREKNILISNNGTVKVIDFGIGKILQEYSLSNDSLISKIRRPQTLPQEYQNKTYTTKTDMFYLSELLNRLIKENKLNNEFSFQKILDKMMERDSNNRYESFTEIKNIINNKEFDSFNITEEEKIIYQNFSNSLKNSIANFIDDKSFNNNIEDFQNKLKEIIKFNSFEIYIQNNKDFIKSIVKSRFSHYYKSQIQIDILRKFVNWLDSLSENQKQVVFQNLIYKLSSINIEYTSDIPF